jgi:YD repeat-containing protein
VWWQYGDALGRNWSSNLHSRRITYTSSVGGSTPTAEVERGDSRHYIFTWSISENAWTISGDIVDRLTGQKDGQGNPTGWTYYDSDSESMEQYNGAGRILTLTTRSGLATTFGYNGSGQLATVTDSFAGRSPLLRRFRSRKSHDRSGGRSL